MTALIYHLKLLMMMPCKKWFLTVLIKTLSLMSTRKRNVKTNAKAGVMFCVCLYERVRFTLVGSSSTSLIELRQQDDDSWVCADGTCCKDSGTELHLIRRRSSSVGVRLSFSESCPDSVTVASPPWRTSVGSRASASMALGRPTDGV